MNRKEFEDSVKKSIDDLPVEFLSRIHNLVFQVEDGSDSLAAHSYPMFSRILGLYHGVPYKYRSHFYGNLPPDVIIIYKKAIESVCRTDEEIKEKIREVVVHEIGHYFGLSENELRDIEER